MRLDHFLESVLSIIKLYHCNCVRLYIKMHFITFSSFLLAFFVESFFKALTCVCNLFFRRSTWYEAQPHHPWYVCSVCSRFPTTVGSNISYCLSSFLRYNLLGVPWSFPSIRQAFQVFSFIAKILFPLSTIFHSIILYPQINPFVKLFGRCCTYIKAYKVNSPRHQKRWLAWFTLIFLRTYREAYKLGV